MIPVWGFAGHYKPKLPKAYSWAVGTQRLSERFASIPQMGDIVVWFDDRPKGARTRLDQIIPQGVPYQVFTVWYYPSGTPRWHLMVYPVAAERKSVVRGLLEAAAFPKVEAWLCEPKTDVWMATGRHLRCIYHPCEGRIEVKEDGG
jgi:hypothetical protein